MDEQYNQQGDKKVKHITLGFILGWALGILAAINGLICLFSQPMVGLLMLLLAAVLLPPVNNFIADKFKFSISGGLKFVIVITLLVIIGITFSSKQVDEIFPSKESIPTLSTDEEAESTKSYHKSYQQIFTFSGDGAKKSEPFIITGDRFKIAYECTGDSTFTLCQAFVYEVGSALPQVIVNTDKSIKDETIIYGSGEYYIDANMLGSFNMTVYDYR